MALFLGSSEPDALYVGGSSVDAVYLGTTQLWPAGVRLVGSLEAISALSGQLGVARPLAAELVASSLFSGALAAQRLLSGALAALSDMSGDLSVFDEVLLEGDLAAVSALSGGISVLRTLAGSLASSTSLTGAASVARGMSGSMASVSALSGAVSAARALSGTLAAASALTGALTVTPGTLTSLSFVASATANAASINVPGGAQAGDIGVLIQQTIQGIGVPTLVTPAGWTPVADASMSSNRIAICIKALVGADSGASLTGMNGDNSNQKTVLVFRPNGTFSSLTAVSVAGEATNNNPAQQTITVAAQVTPTILIGQGCFGFATPTVTGTLVTNGVNVSNTLQQVYYEIQNGAKANRTIDVGDGGNLNGLQSFGLVVA